MVGEISGRLDKNGGRGQWAWPVGDFIFESSKIIELAEIGQLDLKINSGGLEILA